MKLVKALNICIAALALSIIVLLTTGFIGGPKYECSYRSYTVGKGQTLWEIANVNYIECASATRMCFEEYLYNMRQENIQLFQNGRMLQPGDSVKVPVYTVVK